MPEMVERTAADRGLVERVTAGVSLESLAGEIVCVNPALARMLGYPDPSMIEGRLAESLFFDPADAERHRREVLSRGSVTEEVRLRTAAGEALWVMSTAVATGDPRTGELEVLRTVIDIMTQKAAIERLERDAYHDPLTGLPNRRLLRIRAEQTLAMARRRRERAALLFLDLIGFKAVNDRLGHGAGDKLLEQVGRRIEGTLRTVDVAARQGGDEFVVLLAEVDGAASAKQAAARLGGHLARAPYLLPQRSVNLEARFGIAIFPDHAEDLDGLLAHADVALAEAKREGGPVIRLAPMPAQGAPSPDGASLRRDDAEAGGGAQPTRGGAASDRTPTSDRAPSSDRGPSSDGATSSDRGPSSRRAEA